MLGYSNTNGYRKSGVRKLTNRYTLNLNTTLEVVAENEIEAKQNFLQVVYDLAFDHNIIDSIVTVKGVEKND